MNNNFLNTLYLKLQKNKNKDVCKSYTAKLINNPELLVKKIGEESIEVIIEIIRKDKEKIIRESADLLYHIVVSWIYAGVKPEEIWKELEKRSKIPTKK